MRVELLGQLRVVTPDGVLAGACLGGGRPRQVLVALALAEGAVVSKDRLVDLIWGPSAPPRAVATLETYVSVLRRSLDPAARGRRGPVRTVPGGYSLDPALVDSDVATFRRTVGTARRSGAPNRDLRLTGALALHRGPLADGESWPWLDAPREQIRRELAECRLLAAEAASTAGRHEEAVGLARDAVADDPLDETARATTMQVLLAAQLPCDALRSYDDARRVLARELGCSPGPALRALHAEALRAVATSDDDLAELFASVMRLRDASVRRLPRQRRPGLAEDQQRLRRLLAGGGDTEHLVPAI